MPSLSSDAPRPEDLDRAQLGLRQQAARFQWQQVVELTPTVVTPGALDYRAVRQVAGLPDSLDGLRCLDVARRDGFWAFELESRGAAEVVALEWEPYADTPELVEKETVRSDSSAYAFARELKESTVRTVRCHPYDVGEEHLGSFDLIFVADVLSRLRNPELALERLIRICRGTVILAEPFDPRFDRYGEFAVLEYEVEPGSRPTRWWKTGVLYWLRAMQMAGYQHIQERGRWQTAVGKAEPIRYVVLSGSVAEPTTPATRTQVGRHGINLMGAKARAPKPISVSVSAEVVLNLGRGPHELEPVRKSPDLAAPTPSEQIPDALRERIDAVDWYHTIDLGNGVITRGFVDHRSQVPLYHLPESLEGKRCLDVATFDGFWAFELEKRGAAEVVAADIKNRTDGDIPYPLWKAVSKHLEAPMGAGFRVAHEVIGSHVKHEICNVYELSPSRVGTFDFVFISDLLLHIRDPQLALERAFSVCRGSLLVADVFLPGLDHYGDRSLTACRGWMPGSYTWWLPAVQTLKRMLAVAGFEEIREMGRFRLATLGGDAAKVVLHATVPNRRQKTAPLARLVVNEPAGAEAES